MAKKESKADFIGQDKYARLSTLPHHPASGTIAAIHTLGSSPMRAFVATTLAVALFSVASVSIGQTAAVDTPRVGTFKQVEGEAWVGKAADGRTAVSGDGIQINQRISTGKKGAASITLKDGTVLTIGPNSTMDLSQFEFNTTTHNGNFLLDLVQGSVRVVTGLLGKANPEKFKVKTPTSVVGVRGTDFIVETEAFN
jgi:hypothetical protein